MSTALSPVRARTLRALVLARELDAARTAAGMTTRTLATLMSMSPAMVNRVMTGRRPPTALEIGALCAFLDVPALRRRSLYALASEVDKQNWLHDNTSDTPSPLPTLLDLADSVTTYSATHVPEPRRPHDFDHTGADPATTHLIHERALSDPRSARHLTSLTGDVHIVPAGHNSPPHSFHLLHIPHFHPVVHAEHNTMTIILETPSATAPYLAQVATLLTHARPPNDVP
ncbi:helix-turn-helix domain-containing protein [Actinokineospora bangkokensis]|uniref:HTH cro/C1-type domain-containing protein n=1 Tax=Actinokineospora bangkokensis TaxID=1193682 RepID=A0A1Q9LKJ6_9PSEU|nr:helix-turn-helix domain-containing protein [Actinokineospora bangkokensis]OLR92540.1 hypothetical protein BJP25_20985 [Actinokineospora bangkokensis]